MRYRLDTKYIGPDTKNDLYKKGYRFIVNGDYRILDTIDPWSGMPDTTNNVYAFTDRAEAEAFAETQIWVFNPEVHAKVEELPEHTETYKERRAREDKEKAERKAKREAKEAQKAAEVDMTVEEYRKAKAHKAQITRVKNEIKRLEDQLANLKETLVKLEA